MAWSRENKMQKEKPVLKSELLEKNRVLQEEINYLKAINESAERAYRQTLSFLDEAKIKISKFEMDNALDAYYATENNSLREKLARCLGWISAKQDRHPLQEERLQSAAQYFEEQERLKKEFENG
jgi:hypothetical protein